jgi:steroid delta-isomerase-like uncharacterized protein
MSEANKELVRRVIEEIWTGGNLDLIDELYAEDFVCHFEPAEDWIGRSGVREWVSRVRTSFSEYEERIEDLIAEGDRVVVHMTVSGVNTGPTPIGSPATGKQISTLGILIYRVAHGQIAEQWEVANVGGILRQLGVLPGPPPT